MTAFCVSLNVVPYTLCAFFNRMFILVAHDSSTAARTFPVQGVHVMFNQSRAVWMIVLL